MWKILKEMGIPDYLTCLLRNLYAGQEATAEGQDVVSARGDHQPFLQEPRTGPVTAQLVTEVVTF